MTGWLCCDPFIVLHRAIARSSYAITLERSRLHLTHRLMASGGDSDGEQGRQLLSQTLEMAGKGNDLAALEQRRSGDRGFTQSRNEEEVERNLKGNASLASGNELLILSSEERAFHSQRCLCCVGRSLGLTGLELRVLVDTTFQQPHRL